MIFVRPLLMKSAPSGTETIWKLVMRKDPRTGKMQVYTQRYHVSPEEAKMPRFREVSEDEIKGYRELLQRIGEIASDFMGDLAEKWRAGKGNEVRMLFREEKLFNRELGRSHLNIHAAMCLHS